LDDREKKHTTTQDGQRIVVVVRQLGGTEPASEHRRALAGRRGAEGAGSQLDD
jgi:hypothetical protein